MRKVEIVHTYKLTHTVELTVVVKGLVPSEKKSPDMFETKVLGVLEGLILS